MSKRAAAIGALLLACGVPEPAPRATPRLLPLSYALPNGDGAVAGWYNADDETLTLSEDVLLWGQEQTATITIELADDVLALPPGEDTVDVALSLAPGDTLLAHAGEATPLALVVEDADFTGPPDDLEVVEFGDGSVASCGVVEASASTNARIKFTGWGCGHAFVGFPGDAVTIGVDDHFTDGLCVQVWLESNAGNWFYATTSCGPRAGGDYALPGSGLKRARMFLGGSSDKSSRSTPPPGRYQTLCGPGSGLSCS